MKWLILSDNDDIKNKCADFLSSNNKKDKIFTSELTLKGVKENKKNLKELASCIIFANDEQSIDAPLGAGLSTIFGFFASEGIPVITNIKLLYNDPLFGKDIGLGCKSGEEIYETLTREYSRISDEASMRLAKQKLLNRFPVSGRRSFWMRAVYFVWHRWREEHQTPLCYSFLHSIIFGQC